MSFVHCVFFQELERMNHDLSNKAGFFNLTQGLFKEKGDPGACATSV